MSWGATGRAEKENATKDGSAWESNPPATRLTHGSAILKTAPGTSLKALPGNESDPLHAYLLLDAFFEVSKQAADDIPPVSQSHFDVALLVHSHYRVVRHASLCQVPDVQFIVPHERLERFARHFDKLHGYALKTASLAGCAQRL